MMKTTPLAILLSTAFAATLLAQAPSNSNLPPLEKVTEGYDKVISTVEGDKSFYTIWRRNKDQQLLAELPKDFAKQRHYIALTVASGESYAGLQAGEAYVYWRRYGNRMALIEPNLDIRSTGDAESKASVKRLFTDKVLLDVPILTEVPKGGPVIDLDALLIEHAEKFFGSSARGLRKNLVTIKTAKAFPENVEVGLEVPGGNGLLKTFHYSFSLIPENKDYKPRKADERVGFFVTSYTDFGKYKEDETIVRYINRWHLEKADKNLKLSPPKEPIVFYIEHTTPIRYRRWVREGILMWNEAFEKVGLIDAIEVRQQDAATGAHMEKDPEDVRYNFVRWLNNGVGTAIGPSRVNPMTGQILDADIILTDGWIRHYWTQYHEILPDLAVEGYSPKTLAWLYKNPKWDPRVRLAPSSNRESLLTARAQGTMPELGGHALGNVNEELIGDQEFDGLMSNHSQQNGLCMAANCKTHGIALHQMMQMVIAAEEEDKAAAGEDASAKSENNDEEEEDKEKAEDSDKEEEKKESEKSDEEKEKEEGTEVVKNDEGDEEQMLDGVPEDFIGPLLAELVAHEVGHTIGLRHNFKASSIYTMEEINSDAVKGKKPFAGSVMDYIPVNMNVDTGEVQGDYTMISVGPYDKWAIEYGYTFKEELDPILNRSSEPELAYATDEDTWGPDPLARRYDFAKDVHGYAQNQMRLVEKNRAIILDKFVKDGQSWAKARRGYELTLSAQIRALSMMANWVGGTHVYRDKKGTPNARAPIEVVPVERQREALKFVVDNAFNDEVYGLTPELLRYMTVEKWWGEQHGSSILDEPDYPIHDRILGVQASVLTALMKPSTLEEIYDNEFRTPADEDALTIPELLDTLRDSIWGDLEVDGEFTARKPMISSLQRNLQKEYIERLVDLMGPDSGLSIAEKPVRDLATLQLEELQKSVDAVKGDAKLDPYSKAHLNEVSKQISKALDAQYVVPVS